MNGIPVPVVSRLLGHSSVGMNLHYVHLGDRDVRVSDSGKASAVTGGSCPGTSPSRRGSKASIPHPRMLSGACPAGRVGPERPWIAFADPWWSVTGPSSRQSLPRTDGCRVREPDRHGHGSGRP